MHQLHQLHTMHHPMQQFQVQRLPACFARVPWCILLDPPTPPLPLYVGGTSTSASLFSMLMAPPATLFSKLVAPPATLFAMLVASPPVQ